MKLNLGCGNHKRAGYINIDIYPDVDPDICVDITKLHFEKNSVDEVYMSNALEHLSKIEAEKLLNKIYNWLKPESKLYLAVPNLQTICKLISEGNEDEILFKWLYGSGSGIKAISHQWGYTKDKITILLNSIGFKNFQEFYGGSDDSDFKYKDKKLSLNVVCVK